jgi:multicomponent Na+:H+ antiporter subunit E
VNAGNGTKIERVGEVSRARSGAARGVAYFAFWLVLMPSQKPADLVLGLLAAAAAAWLSLRLLPPESGRLRFSVMLALMPHFVFESVRAGVDVARRALAPQVRLNPGFVDCPMAFPPGLARNTFATISSLLPGSVPCGESDGEFLSYHCIDVSEPVIEQLCAEERVLARALVAGQTHA